MTIKDISKNNIGVDRNAILRGTDEDGREMVCLAVAYSDNFANKPIKAILVEKGTLIFQL